jgi:hypothetical protein
MYSVQSGTDDSKHVSMATGCQGLSRVGETHNPGTYRRDMVSSTSSCLEYQHQTLLVTISDFDDAVKIFRYWKLLELGMAMTPETDETSRLTRRDETPLIVVSKSEDIGRKSIVKVGIKATVLSRF